MSDEYLNVLKVRDDEELLFDTVTAFHSSEERPKPTDRFTLRGDPPEWLKTSSSEHEEYPVSALRTRIEPWLTSLVQSEHLAVLVGAGLTHAVHTMAADRPAAGMSKLSLKSPHAPAIDAAAGIAASRASREVGNLEDQLRVANELLRGLQILGASAGDEGASHREHAQSLANELDDAMMRFAKSILQSEAGIASAQPPKREKAYIALIDFLMSFASRTGTRDRLSVTVQAPTVPARNRIMSIT